MLKYDLACGIGEGFAIAQARMLSEVYVKLKEGWVPCGGVALVYDSRLGGCYATQALIKEEEE